MITVTIQAFGIELEVIGNYEPAEESSLYDPGSSAYFEIEDVRYDGKSVPAFMHSEFLMETIEREACDAAENEIGDDY
jgi:hypothetical protein